MGQRTVAAPLQDLDQAELARLARVAERLLAGRPRVAPGNRPQPRRAGHGVEFLDHRPFMPGDSPRDIDWRASARSRQPQIRRFRDETTADWFICLDVSASMGLPAGGKWPLALRLAAALGYLLIHLDHRLGLILFSDRVEGLRPLGRGRQAYAGLWRLLERSAPRPAGGTRLGCCLPHLGRGAQVVVISDFLTPDGLHGDLARLAGLAETVHALQVLDSAEASLAETGFLSLRDVETGETLGVEATAANSAEAARRLQTLGERLRRHCHQQRIAFSACTTAQRWQEVLLGHLLGTGACRAGP